MDVLPLACSNSNSPPVVFLEGSTSGLAVRSTNAQTRAPRASAKSAGHFIPLSFRPRSSRSGFFVLGITNGSSTRIGISERTSWRRCSPPDCEVMGETERASTQADVADIKRARCSESKEFDVPSVSRQGDCSKWLQSTIPSLPILTNPQWRAPANACHPHRADKVLLSQIAGSQQRAVVIVSPAADSLKVNIMKPVPTFI